MSQGAQEIFRELPHEYVPPSMLQKVAEHGGIVQCRRAVQNKKKYTQKKIKHIILYMYHHTIKIIYE